AILISAATTILVAVAVLFIRTQRVPEPGESAEAGSIWLGLARMRADRMRLVGVLRLGGATLTGVLGNVAEEVSDLDDSGAPPPPNGRVTALWRAAGAVGGWSAGRLIGDTSCRGGSRARRSPAVWRCSRPARSSRSSRSGSAGSSA